MSTSAVGRRLDVLVGDRLDASVLLVLPIVLFEVAFFVIPFLLLVRMSLYEPGAAGVPYVEGTWSVTSFVSLAGSSYLQHLFVFTMKMAVIATAITVVLAFCYAYVLWRSRGWVKTVLLVAVVLPLLTSLVVKLYSWVLLLAPAGTINTTLVDAAVVGEPIQLMGNLFGVTVGLVYTTLPFAVLPIYSVLENTEWSIVEAARDLGAGRLRSVVEIVVPQAVPGIVVATVVVWTWNVGAFAAPDLLGSGRNTTLAIAVEDLLLTDFDWPAAAALSLVMLAIIVASVVVLFQVLDRWEEVADA